MADLNQRFLIFYVTHPDEESAKRLTGALIAEKLVACGNIFPVQSMYEWNGAFVQEGEWVSVLKTSLDRELAVENAVSRLHPYEVPCIVRYEVRANESYIRWIEECTKA